MLKKNNSVKQLTQLARILNIKVKKCLKVQQPTLHKGERGREI